MPTDMLYPWARQCSPFSVIVRLNVTMSNGKRKRTRHGGSSHRRFLAYDLHTAKPKKPFCGIQKQGMLQSFKYTLQEESRLSSARLASLWSLHRSLLFYRRFLRQPPSPYSRCTLWEIKFAGLDDMNQCTKMKNKDICDKDTLVGD